MLCFSALNKFPITLLALLRTRKLHQKLSNAAIFQSVSLRKYRRIRVSTFLSALTFFIGLPLIHSEMVYLCLPIFQKPFKIHYPDDHNSNSLVHQEKTGFQGSLKYLRPFKTITLFSNIVVKAIFMKPWLSKSICYIFQKGILSFVEFRKFRIWAIEIFSILSEIMVWSTSRGEFCYKLLRDFHCSRFLTF